MVIHVATLARRARQDRDLDAIDLTDTRVPIEERRGIVAPVRGTLRLSRTNRGIYS